MMKMYNATKRTMTMKYENSALLTSDGSSFSHLREERGGRWWAGRWESRMIRGERLGGGREMRVVCEKWCAKSGRCSGGMRRVAKGSVGGRGVGRRVG